MNTFIVVTTLISVLLNAGIALKSLHLNWKNQNIRQAVMQTVSTITSQLKSGRLKASTLLSALQNNNQAALSTFLYQNPAISKTLEEINADSKLISELQSSLNHWESVISNLQAEISQLGYSQSHAGLGAEQDTLRRKQSELRSARNEHAKVVERIENTHVGTHRDFKVDTSHLDAVSQNINGGLTK